jgi:hypothetical protein
VNRLHQPDAPQAVDDETHSVRHLHHHADRRRHSHAVEVRKSGSVVLDAHLADDADDAVLRHRRIVDQPHRGLPPDGHRHHDRGEEHVVPKRQDGQLVRDEFAFLGLTLAGHFLDVLGQGIVQNGDDLTLGPASLRSLVFGVGSSHQGVPVSG